MIRDAGVEPVVIDYQKTPPSPSEIKAVLQEMGMRPRQLLRRRGTPYDEIGLDDANLSDAKLVAAMTQQPLLIERPVVRTGKGTRLCRPPEKVREIL